MSRILIRSGKNPLTAVSPEASLSRDKIGVFAANVGNLFFTSAVHRAVSVPGAEVVSNSYLTERGGIDDQYIDQINNEFDSFVVPLANAFRVPFIRSLERLTHVIERLTIPVTVVGVGAQLSLSGDTSKTPENLNRAVRAFVSAVLDRSASIGVRGEITRDYLRLLGFDDSVIDIIGCPSLFREGGELRIKKKVADITENSPIALNSTPNVTQMAPIIAQHTSRYPNLTYIAQVHAELAMMMWGEELPSQGDPRMPSHMSHPLYQEDRMRFFLDVTTWTDYMAEMDFAFGTRIHGNIAALAAGTPAMVLAHDSRTLELAEHHKIPHRLITEVPSDVDAAELYDQADVDAFNVNHPKRFQEYRSFLDRNEIRHIFTPGNENPAFDDELSAVKFPPAVRTLLAPGDAGRVEIISRLRWLRQGAETDVGRQVGAYRPPFDHTSKAPPMSGKELENRLKLITKQQTTIEGQKRRIAELERLMGAITQSLPVRIALAVRRLFSPRRRTSSTK